MININLEELLINYWGRAVYDFGEDIAPVDSVLRKENFLRKLLPGGAVRRLDAGLARSNTVHPDTARALYAICRTLSPACVFETGTYWGYSTAYLAAAVRDNGYGIVHTFDIYARAGKHLPRNLRSYVQMHLGQPSTEAIPSVLSKLAPQLFFQDSRHDFEGVSQELKMVTPNMPSNSVVLIHDFIDKEVRRAVTEILSPEQYDVFALEGQDPQQLGVAVKKNV
jgi:hypothetical protein